VLKLAGGPVQHIVSLKETFNFKSASSTRAVRSVHARCLPLDAQLLLLRATPSHDGFMLL
jgi:hypothetical protein